MLLSDFQAVPKSSCLLVGTLDWGTGVQAFNRHTSTLLDHCTAAWQNMKRASASWVNGCSAGQGKSHHRFWMQQAQVEMEEERKRHLLEV